MVSGSLALLYFLLSFHGGKQGSGPNRGRSPVEWGDFPFVRPSVRLSVHPSIRPSVRPWVERFSKPANSEKFNQIQQNLTKLATFRNY